MKTTSEITSYLDQFVIGQFEPKRAIAVAYRERALRVANEGEEWKYIVPNNLLMIGASGTGKTEVARQLAELTDAPFIKVEITEFTQVGFYGRDVKTILTDLLNEAIRIAPGIWREQNSSDSGNELLAFLQEVFLTYKQELAEHLKHDPSTLTFTDVRKAFGAGKFKKLNLPAEIWLKMLIDDARKQPQKKKSAVDTMLEDLGLDFGTKPINVEAAGYLSFIVVVINNEFMSEQPSTDFLQTIVSGDTYKKLLQRAKGKLTDTKVRGVFMGLPEREVKTIAEKLAKFVKTPFMEIVKEVRRKAPATGEVPDEFIVKLIEERGIIFIDEIDKIFVDTSGGNVGNIGVVRDLLPYLDGVTMNVPTKHEREQGGGLFGDKTKYYRINTANILWIASGAFNIAKVSDVPAEILGRLPVHVKFDSLDVNALYGILNKPHGSVVSRLKLLMEAEGVEFTITDEAVMAMAQLAFDCNTKGEDIGARRLISISSQLFDQLRYDASNMPEGSSINIDATYINERRQAIWDLVPVRVERFKPVNTETAVLANLASLLKKY